MKRAAISLVEDAAPTGAVAVPRLILDVAAKLLRQRGYEAMTVRAIAEQVGIKAGSIYYHYPSKDAIAAAVVNEGVDVVHQAVTTALAALPSHADATDRLEAAVRAHLLSSLQNSDYTSASIRAFTFLPDGIREESRLRRRRYEKIWAGIVTDAAAAGLIRPDISTDVVRLMLLGAVNWAGEWYRPEGRLTIERISHDFAELVFGQRPR